jgi:hypothetical protein
MTAVVGVDAGGAEAAEDGAEKSVAGEGLALAEGQLVDVVERNAMRDVALENYTYPIMPRLPRLKKQYKPIGFIDSMVELSGIEPLTSSLRTRRSPN